MQLPMLSNLTPAQLRAAAIYAQCQSRAVTAHKLGLSPSTVRRLLQTARERLAKDMNANQRDYWLRPVGRPRSIRVGSLSDIVNV